MPKNLIKVGEGKLQSFGGSFYICVPAIWRKSVGCHKGDRLEMFATGNDELIVKPVKDNGGFLR